MKTLPVGRGFNTIIDDEDFERVSRYSWHVSNYEGVGGYPTGVVGTATDLFTNLALASYILRTTDMVDHIDGDPLNNTRRNLRFANKSQNGANRKVIQSNNTSGYKGITKRNNRWLAQIGVKGNKMYLGSFLTREEAAKAYNVAAIKYFGEFARLNPITPQPPFDLVERLSTPIVAGIQPQNGDN